MMEWVNTIVQGVLLGGLYAIFAAGLSLIFGVMRLVNIAHGDLIVLAAYVALLVTTALGLNPVLSILIVAPVMAALGFGQARRVFFWIPATSALTGPVRPSKRIPMSSSFSGFATVSGTPVATPPAGSSCHRIRVR